jgi:hypothetical protein
VFNEADGVVVARMLALPPRLCMFSVLSAMARSLFDLIMHLARIPVGRRQYLAKESSLFETNRSTGRTLVEVNWRGNIDR